MVYISGEHQCTFPQRLLGNFWSTRVWNCRLDSTRNGERGNSDTTSVCLHIRWFVIEGLITVNASQNGAGLQNLSAACSGARCSQNKLCFRRTSYVKQRSESVKVVMRFDHVTGGVHRVNGANIGVFAPLTWMFSSDHRRFQSPLSHRARSGSGGYTYSAPAGPSPSFPWTCRGGPWEAARSLPEKKKTR